MFSQKNLVLLQPVENLLKFRRRSPNYGNYTSDEANAIKKMRELALRFIPGVEFAINSGNSDLLRELLLLYAGKSEDFSNIFGRNVFDTYKCKHFGSYIIALKKAFPEADINVFDFEKMPDNYYRFYTEADLIREAKIFFQVQDEMLAKKKILNHFERSSIRAPHRPIRRTLTREKAFAVAMVHIFISAPQIRQMVLKSELNQASLELKNLVKNFTDFQKYITGSILHKRRYMVGQKSLKGWQEALNYIASEIKKLKPNAIQKFILESEKRANSAA